MGHVNRHVTAARVRCALLLIPVMLAGLAIVRAEQKPDGKDGDKPQKKKSAIGTLDEVLALLEEHPRDPYLQYVALQLGRREERSEDAEQAVALASGSESKRFDLVKDRAQDLFNPFNSGPSAQETLQLTALRKIKDEPDEEHVKRAKEVIEIGKIGAPELKSREWDKLLGGKKPEFTGLAKSVPEDFYFVGFRSPSKLLELMDASEQWLAHVFHQAARDARSHAAVENIRKQLALDTGGDLRAVYDSVISEVALTGSDLLLAEGSDVTLVFRLKVPDLFKKQVDGSLAKLSKEREDVKRTEGKYLGFDYVQHSAPERDINVFSAYPEEKLYVRSNSKAAFQRVLAAIKGEDEKGNKVHSLGDTAEFAYIRTLLPEGAREEDGLVYLSEGFLRHQLGPQLRLAQRRRMLCYNELRMIGHAALMYRAENGRAPRSIDELFKGDCCPASFNTGDFQCSDGGKYTLSADGTCGVCSHHGSCRHMIPNCDNALNWVSGTEADEYEAVAKEWTESWLMLLSPLAARMQVAPKQLRMETVVLPPLEDEARKVYDQVAKYFGKPAPLDALPIPKRNVFTFAGCFNKDEVLKLTDDADFTDAVTKITKELQIPEKDIADLDIDNFLHNGLGDQISLNGYDAQPVFDMNLVELVATMASNHRLGDRAAVDAYILLLIGAMDTPLYFSVPVKDEKVVDEFLDKLDRVMAKLVRFNSDKSSGPPRFQQDFYKTRLSNGGMMRSWTMQVGPAKGRLYYARIGKALYLATKATKQPILEDSAQLEKARGKDRPDADPEGTAQLLLRIRANNWNEILDDYRLGWEESIRESCLNNLGPIGSAGRALVGKSKSDKGEEDLGALALKLAEQVHGVRFVCPDGGKYLLSKDGKTCSCSLHGTKSDPRQALAPSETGIGKLLREYGGLTASLTFKDDALSAVLIMERK